VSRFSETLSTVLDDSKESRRQVALASGLDPATLHNLVKGETALTADSLRKLCTHFRAEPLVAYRLLTAHLLDVADDSGLPLDSYEVGYKSTLPTIPKVSEPVMDAFRIIGPLATQVGELRKVIENLAELALAHAGARNDAKRLDDMIRKGAVYPFPEESGSKVAEGPPAKSPAATKPRKGTSRPAPPVPAPGKVG
jgi:transcriptional regulator with XRE-family HTH domain